MKRTRLETTCVGIQDIEKTIKEMKERFKDKRVRIELYEFSTIENCFSLVVWEVK